MDTVRKTGTLMGVVDAAWENAAKQAADKAEMRKQLDAGEDAVALDMLRDFLGCRKPIVRATYDDVSKRRVK